MTRPLLAAATAAGLLVPVVDAQDLVLNEVFPNAGDAACYVELAGAPGTSLLDHYLVVVDGDAAEHAQLDQVVPLAGVVPADGHFLVGTPHFAGVDQDLASTAAVLPATFERGGWTLALVHVPSPGTARGLVEFVGRSLDPDGDGNTVLELHPRMSVVDAVYVGATGLEVERAPHVAPPDGGGVFRTSDASRRWCRFDFLTAGPATGHHTPGAANPGVDPGPALLMAPPPGYYDTVDTTSSAALRDTLHAVIDDHTRLPYTSGSTDTWDVLEMAQENPALPFQILDVYKNASYTKGSSSYNREHTWPVSLGFPNDGADNYPFTDCHMLRLCDAGYNTARSNRPYRFCAPTCTEHTTDGGTIGVYPGESNWSSGSFVTGTWETWWGRRGDVARGLLYADVRYAGGTHGVTAQPEPDLVLTDVQTLISNSQTGANLSTAYMGLRSVLLQWHLDDPVDAFEQDRNDVVFAFQGNRNPFVDHPEWVDCLFNGNCAGAEIYCSPAQINTTNAPGAMDWAGSLTVADDDFDLIAYDLPTNQFGFFMCSLTQGLVLNPGGSAGHLCLGGQIGRFITQVQNTGTFGFMQIQVDLGALPVTPTHAVVPGETWNFQAWYRDTVLGFPSSNFTDGLEVTFD
jgi:endonuclease I